MCGQSNEVAAREQGTQGTKTLNRLELPPIDAADDPLHGNQEGRFFHGYYKCYCYLSLCVTCGDRLPAARLRTSNRDAVAGGGKVVLGEGRLG